MPGMENFAPERTLSSSGSTASPSFLPHLLFELRDGGVDFLLDFRGDVVFVLEIDIADVRGDGEARRYGQPGAGHFGQPGALAAERIFHVAVAVGGAAAERINVPAHLVVSFEMSGELVTISEKSAMVENSASR